MKTTSPSASAMTTAVALRVFLPFALGYFLSYLYRVVNAVIAPDLVADLGLDASTLGLLTAVFFLTFAAFQLPLGILLDHYGPRRVEAALLVFAAMGAVLFAVAPNTPVLIVARGLIGFGVSACLMAAFKAYVMWFPRERLALINGFQMMSGGLGALAATQPVEFALGFTDWRGVFLILGGLTVISAFLVYTVVPEHGGGRHPEAKISDTFAGVKEIFVSAQFWRVAPHCVMSQAVFTSVVSLWSGPWLRDVAGLERDLVAHHLFWIAAAMIAGFLTWGLMAERLQKLFGVRPMSVAAIGMSGFMVVQALVVIELPVSQPSTTLMVWMAFGFFGTAGIVPFAALSQAFPTHLAGRVNTALNLLIFVMAFVAQWAVGAVIDLWPQTASGGYAPDGYQVAFAVMLSLQVVALAWYVMRRAVRI